MFVCVLARWCVCLCRRNEGKLGEGCVPVFVRRVCPLKEVFVCHMSLCRSEVETRVPLPVNYRPTRW